MMAGLIRTAEKIRMMIIRGASLRRLTYDVDDDYVKAILCSDDNVAHLIESSIPILPWPNH
jgi:hypothetical protein